MAGDTTGAQELFDQTFGRTMKVQSFIWSFQLYMVHGAPSAAEAIAEEAEKTARDFLSSPNFGTEEQRKAAMAPLEMQVRGATLDTIHNAHAAAEAACIVFAHSMIDAAVLDYCRVAAMLNVEDWVSEVLTDRITLQQARSTDLDVLLREAVEAYMRKLGNRSLLAKIDVLQTVCKPGGAEIRKGYRFDRARIKAMDDLRIAIIHKDAFGERIPATGDGLAYLWETNLYLSALISHRYGLRLSTRAMAFLTPGQPAEG
jgi:hypothetical protein